MGEDENKNKPDDTSFEKTISGGDIESVSHSDGSDFQSGQILQERYRIIRLLGKGGMGSVYLVEQIYLKQKLALKTLSNQGFGELALRRFQKEAQAASKLSHPNLVQAHEFGVLNNGQPYFTMDFVEGPSLAEYSKAKGTLSEDEALEIFIPVCFGLAYAHDQRVVHRDLKPSNIMLAKSSDEKSQFTAKVVDFGIAKLTDNEQGKSVMLTKTGEVFGTPLYMSPEQCLGSGVDHRSDIYSLACVLFECLTGAPPFSGENALSLMMKHQSEGVPSLKEGSLGKEFSPLLEQVIAKALQKDPAERYQSLYEMASELSLLKQPEIETRPTFLLKKTEVKTEALQNAPLDRLKILGLVSISSVFFLFLGGVLALQFVPRATPQIKELPESNSTQSIAGIGMQTFYNGTEKNERLFDFPQHSIGRIRYSVPGAHQWKEIDAAGSVRIPKGALLWLEINDFLFYNYPQSLLCFGDTDISVLQINFEQNVKDVMVNQEAAYDSAMAICGHWKNLTKVGMKQGYVTDIGIECLKELPYLNALQINRSHATSKSVGKLRNFDSLVELELAGVKGSKELVPRIAKNKVIIGLNLSEDDLDDQHILKLSELKSLHILQLRHNPRITDSSMPFLTRLINLESLDLTGCTITGASCEMFKQFTKLTMLQLSSEFWNDEQLKILKSSLPKGCRLVLNQHRGGVHYAEK